MGLPSSGRFPLLCEAPVISGSLVEAEELLFNAGAFGLDVVEAGASGTDVVEVTPFAAALVSFLEVFLSWVVLPDDGPPRALATCGASIAAAATQTQSQFFMLGHLYGWEDAACPAARVLVVLQQNVAPTPPERETRKTCQAKTIAQKPPRL